MAKKRRVVKKVAKRKSAARKAIVRREDVIEDMRCDCGSGLSRSECCGSA